jgi:hypothetical protein
MRTGEWLVSALIVAFIGLKVAEGALRIESWPLSHVPMFAVRMGPDRAPVRISVVGRRGGAEVPLDAGDFGLTYDELRRRLRLGDDTIIDRCRRLGGAYNERVAPALRLEAIDVHFIRFPRPGMAAGPRSLVVPCPLPR